MMPKGLQPPAPSGVIAPASWWEFYFHTYPLNEFVPIPRTLGVRVACGANTSNSAPIAITINCFAYAMRISSFVTATGLAPTIAYAAGWSDASGVNYTGGNWNGKTFGDALDALTDYPFPMPWELPAQTQITCAVDNTLNAGSAAISIDFTLQVIEPRVRNVALFKAR